MANATAIASGVNRNLAAPVSSTTGMKTMQIDKRRNKSGCGDLLGRIENGADERLLLGHVAVRVLDLDRGVVDQDADREGKAAKRHNVDGLAERGEDGHRGGRWTAGSTCRR